MGIAMFGFLRRKKRPQGKASTFVEATGGGWGKPANVIKMPVGSEAECVAEVLRRAKERAQTVAVGESFEFTITDIPMGIRDPHTIIFGLMMQAHEYGLSVGFAMNETVQFTRMA